MESLPRLLADFRPARGVIKQDYEDFIVEELPLYPADGAGTHTYFFLEKRGLSTIQAVHDLARALDVRRRDIGYAGLKDARAVTRQWMSIEHVDPAKIEQLSIPRLTVLDVTRHTNKLRLGHLRGNAFTIRIRGVDGRSGELSEALETLQRRGVPNYFGRQRFGARGDSWKTGRETLRDDLPGALDHVLGNPCPLDFGKILKARQLYQSGEYEKAIAHWPGMFRDERRALKTLVRTKGKKKRAFLAIDRSLRNFYISAYQSYVFNTAVAERLADGLGRLETGDLAWVHGSGAVFEVLDASLEQPRADAFEISPSGPLFGYRMSTPTGPPGDREQRILDSEGLDPRAFRAAHLKIKGARRPLRFRPDEAQVRLGADERGAYLELRFTLSKGCYATSVLRELFDEQSLFGEEAKSGRTEHPPDD